MPDNWKVVLLEEVCNSDADLERNCACIVEGLAVMDRLVRVPVEVSSNSLGELPDQSVFSVLS